jgi:DNA-binding transcriptional MerR regulator
MATLPPKLYFRIGEVASLVGVEPHVLRYWEREFRSIRPTKSAKGQRVYSRRDVENLMRVRDLLYADGFTIAGAKKKLQRSGTEPDAIVEAEAEAGAAPPPEVERAATPPSAADGARGAMAEAQSEHARAALKELRTEIEAFLAELSG